MSFRWWLALSLLSLLACHGKRSDVTQGNPEYRSLITQANDEKMTLAARLVFSLEADSLARMERNIPERIGCLRIAGVLYWKMDSADKAISLFRTLADLAKTIKDSESLGIAYNNIGLIHSERSVYDSAIIYYDKASVLFQALRDSVRTVQARVNTGIAYKNTGSYEKAFGMTVEAARIMESMHGTSDLATAYTTLGNTLKELRRPQEALVYHEKALGIRRGLGDSVGVAGSLNNIGNIYKSSRQFEQALNYYKLSLALKRNYGSKRSRATTLENISGTYFDLKQYGLAEQYGREALELRNGEDDKDGWMTSAHHLAEIYVAHKETSRADTLAMRIGKMADAPIYLRQQLDNALLLEEISGLRKDYPGEILYAKRALDLKDWLFNSDLSAAISKMNVRFRTEEQQKQLELAEKNDALRVQQINKQKYFLILMASIIGLLLIISYLLFQSNKIKKRSRERTELLMSELNHRVKNNLQIVSGILNLQTLITDDPKDIELIEAGRSRIQSIGILHNLLYQKEYTGNVDMGLFLAEITENLGRAYRKGLRPAETLLFIDHISLNAGLAIPLGLITNELLTNVYKYGGLNDGQLRVKVWLTFVNGNYCMQIMDNGLSWDIDAAREERKGLGLLLVDMLAQQLNASWTSYREEEQNVHCICFQ